MTDSGRGKRLHPARLTRRGLLAAVVALSVLVAALLFTPLRALRGERLRRHHREGRPDDSPADSHDIETIAHFMGAVHGRRLVEEHLSLLRERLEYLVRVDDGWRGEFRDLVEFCDQRAKAISGLPFRHAADEVRESVLDRLMRTNVDGLRSQFIALFSAEERTRRLARGATIPKLHRIYLHSPVPWLLRGYTRWPGQPGDLLDYTRPGRPLRCN